MHLLMLRTLVLSCAMFAFSALSAYAQVTIVPDIDVLEKAEVLEAANATTTEGVSGQVLTVRIVEGPDEGQTVTFFNDFTQMKQGETFYVRHQRDTFSDLDTWTVSDPYRLDTLLFFSAIFLVLLFIFGGFQGVRGLASLLGSLVLIFYVLIPGILQGYSATVVSIGVASLIIVIGSYITHGFNRTTSSAVLGMILTVLLTGIGAYYAIHAGRLSGFTSEENVYLNMNTGGNINMLGLLFGGIMIGLLGVLYDMAIGQAVAVEELYRAGKHMTRRDIYWRAIRIGREHIGALVNTLAIAYVGVALPLILLISQTASGSILPILNSEVFATEIVRILIGSIGLILAVPVTTFIATYMLSHMEGKESDASLSHRH